MNKKEKDRILIKKAEQKVIDILNGKPDRGHWDCPLCAEYLNLKQRKKNCIGCPVKKHTGNIHCVGSPMVDWKQHQQIVHYEENKKAGNKGYGWHDQFQFIIRCPKCIELEKKVLQFVRSMQFENENEDISTMKYVK